MCGRSSPRLTRLDTIQAHLVERINTGIRLGSLEPTHGSLLRLFEITKVLQCSTTSVEIAGEEFAVWSESSRARPGNQFLMRQAAALAGGSIEMQRNIISERVLGLPRESAPTWGCRSTRCPTSVSARR